MSEGEEVLEQPMLSEQNYTYTVLGFQLMDIFRFVIAVGIFVGSIFIRRIVSQSAMFLLEKVEAPTPLKETAKHIMGIPLSFATVFVGFYIGGQLLDLPPNMDEVFQKIGESVVNLAVFWLAYQFIDPAANVWMSTSSSKHSFGDEIREIVTKIAKALVLILGFLAIMEVWGINVRAFLAGLGLATFAVGLAAQDTLKNLFASVCLIIDKVFHKGDFITSSAVTGIVEHFGIRVTQVRKLDTSLVFVPNNTLSGGVITNITNGKRREISWNPQLAGNLPDAVVEDVVEKIRYYLEHHDFVENEEAHPLVHVSDVSDGTVTLMVYFHVKMMGLPDHLKVREQIAMQLRRLVLDNKASFALPARSVYLREL